MTQEDKELLLKDLCARLPYGVICKVETQSGVRDIKIDPLNISYVFKLGQFWKDCKPYLRPMSSMTEKEIKELSKIDQKHIIFSARHLTWHLDGEVIDYLNEKMFDWRGLIPKGLALEAPEGMYKNK